MWDLSSLTRDRTRVPCIGRQILNHWTTREVLPTFLNPVFYWWTFRLHELFLTLLICSSVSTSLLSTPCVYFISVIVSFSSYWFFFIFSCFLLKFSLCSSQFFPSSVSILITNALNSLSGKLFICFIGCFFFFPQGFFFLIFSFERNPFVFSFCLTHSVSMKLGYLSWSWRGVLCMWVWVTSSPRVCWKPSPWCEVGLEIERLEPEPGVNWGFSHVHWPSPPYYGHCQVPRCWS